MSVFKVSYLEAPARVNELKGNPCSSALLTQQVSTGIPRLTAGGLILTIRELTLGRSWTSFQLQSHPSVVPPLPPCLGRPPLPVFYFCSAQPMNCHQSISASVSLSPLEDTDILSHAGRQRAPSLLSSLHSSLKSKSISSLFRCFFYSRLLCANFLPTEPWKFLYYFPIPMACLYSDSQAFK